MKNNLSDKNKLLLGKMSAIIVILGVFILTLPTYSDNSVWVEGVGRVVLLPSLSAKDAEESLGLDIYWQSSQNYWIAAKNACQKIGMSLPSKETLTNIRTKSKANPSLGLPTGGLFYSSMELDCPGLDDDTINKPIQFQKPCACLVDFSAVNNDHDCNKSHPLPYPHKDYMGLTVLCVGH